MTTKGTVIISLEYDPNSPIFETRGPPVRIEDYVFVGARARVLPRVTVGQGAVVAVGALVTRNVALCAVMGGVSARPTGEHRCDLAYTLDYC